VDAVAPERRPPREPPLSDVVFPPAETADERGVVLVGGDLEPGTLLDAYRSGLFPMRLSSGDLAWWSPDPRGVLRLDELRVSDSLRRSRRRFATRVNTCFEDVIHACAKRGPEEYQWISDEVRAAYLRLHELGWAHSVETWSIPAEDEPSELVGGLYGIAIGGMFGGESMFFRKPDASKVALAALVDLLRGDGGDAAGRIVDVQWLTPHMASLGAREIARDEYLATLRTALALPLPAAFAGS
jgi:leucyl/phenylalanyl-tRNA---protein transferase